MTVYITNSDNDEIAIIEVDEKFEALIDSWHDGEPEYEMLAIEFRELIERQVTNPDEAYDDLDCAENSFAPLLCW